MHITVSPTAGSFVLRRTWACMVIALVAAHIAYGGFVATLPTIQRVQYVPDDAYYYLSLVCHFVQDGEWTFDGGLSTTTGFQMLHAYLLIAMHTVSRAMDLPFPMTAVLFCLALSVVCFLLILRRAACYGQPAVASALIVLSSVNAFRNASSAMEWPLALMASVLLWSQLTNAATDDFPEKRNIRLVVIALLCCLGVLARLDFALLPACYVTTCIATSRFLNIRSHRWVMVALVTGTIVGGAVVAGHNWLITGDWLHDSVRVKAYWGRLYGYDPAKVVFFASELLVPASLIWAMALRPAGWVPCILASMLAGASTVWLVMGGWRFLLAQARRHPQQTLTVTAALVTVASYLTAYGFTGRAVQYWYTAHLVVPVVILGTCGFRAIQLLNARWCEGASLLIVLCVMGVRLAEMLIEGPFMPWQKHMYLAGVVLRKEFGHTRVGSWNAGIINYYQGGTVANLDGLANHDILPYLERGRFGDYLRDKKIQYVADFTRMLYDPLYAVGQRSSRATSVTLGTVAVSFPCIAGEWTHMQVVAVHTKRKPENGDDAKAIPRWRVVPAGSLSPAPAGAIPLDGGYVLMPLPTTRTPQQPR